MNFLRFLIMAFFVLLSGLIESQERYVELQITGDFLPGEVIRPEIATLDGKDAREHKFLPGKYKLYIHQSGYFPFQEEVEIPKEIEGGFQVEMKKVLHCKPRILSEKISFDVPPPPDMPLHKITLTHPETPDVEQSIHGLVRPGSYILRIRKEGYQLLETKVVIRPDEYPFVIEKELIAQPVVVHIFLTYDVEPPRDLDTARVSCIDIKTGIPRYVEQGSTIKPGKYLLKTQRPGYHFVTREIEIPPGEKVYEIHEKLCAKPRPISFEFEPDGGPLVCAYEITLGGKKVSFQDLFHPSDRQNPDIQSSQNAGNAQKPDAPGTAEVCLLEIKFKRFKTFRGNLQICPGEGPCRLPIYHLEPLKKIEFNIRKDRTTLDGIVYGYVFWEDSKPIEDHHVEKEIGVGRFYYTLWIEQSTKKIQGLCGYLFWEKEVGLLGSGTGNANRISIPHLIDHCEKVAKMKSISASLAVLSDLINKPEMLDSLQSQSKKDRETLIQKVKEWKFSDPVDQETQKKVIETMLNKGKN